MEGTTTDWSADEVQCLKSTVYRVLTSGGTKAQAFKQFASENRARSITSIRYKWISLDCTDGQEVLAKAHPENVPASSAPERASWDTISPDSTATLSGSLLVRDLDGFMNQIKIVFSELEQLRKDMKTAKRKIAKLKKENEELQQENSQYVQAFQLARKHLVPESRPAVIQVNGHGIVESMKSSS